MNRTILTLAATALASATLFVSAAEACISCNYVPEVAHTPVRGQTYGMKKHVPVARHQRAQPSKQRVARHQAQAPRKQAAPKKVTIAKAPAAPQAEATPAPTSTPAKTQVAELGCSKFIATVGTTVTVPCE